MSLRRPTWQYNLEDVLFSKSLKNFLGILDELKDFNQGNQRVLKESERNIVNYTEKAND